MVREAKALVPSGWTRVYAPCPATDWFAEVEYLRIPWVEEAKARKAAEGAPQQLVAARAYDTFATTLTRPHVKLAVDPLGGHRSGADMCAT